MERWTTRRREKLRSNRFHRLQSLCKSQVLLELDHKSFIYNNQRSKYFIINCSSRAIPQNLDIDGKIMFCAILQGCLNIFFLWVLQELSKILTNSDKENNSLCNHSSSGTIPQYFFNDDQEKSYYERSFRDALILNFFS